MTAKRNAISYFTGGTTKVPKMVSYTASQWRMSIQTTQEVLAAHGVSEGSRVLVSHPFAPWAIGQVFTEAAGTCGAHVFPIGLNFMDANFHDIVSRIDFTHVCSTARNMIRWKKLLEVMGKDLASASIKKIFVAGEKLTGELRSDCASMWDAEIIDIYGMAEFDTVGAELPGSDGLVLSPRLEYKIRVDSKTSSLEKGMVGELLIGRPEDGEWHDSGDLIRVLGDYDGTTWPRSVQIAFQNRIEESIALSDGSFVRAWQIRELLSAFPALCRIQVQVCRTATGDEIELLYHTRDMPMEDFDARLVKHFISTSIDLQDSLIHKTVSFIRGRKIDDDGQFYNTPRGKIPMFAEMIPNRVAESRTVPIYD